MAVKLRSLKYMLAKMLQNTAKSSCTEFIPAGFSVQTELETCFPKAFIKLDSNQNPSSPAIPCIQIL
jgi:hypothetical protein